MNMKVLFYKLKNIPNMNKRIYLMIMVLLLVIGGVKAQTVDIHEVIATPGAVQVQVDMLNYTDVAAISLYINYDTDLLSFTNATNTALTGGWTIFASNGLISIVYQATPLGTGYPINGKLLDLNFNYTGGFSSGLTFTDDCEIVNSSLAEVPSTFLNGSVSNDPNINTYTGAAYLISGYADVGETISWPLLTAGNPAFPGAFQTINSFTFHLSYDPVKLTYQSIAYPALTGMTVTGGAGFIDVAWSSPTAQDLSNALLGYLNFTYNGGGAATLSFEPGSVVTSGTTIQNTYFVAGTVDVNPTGPFDGSITINQVASTMGTANVNVPVVASGLSDNPAGAINFTMTFDPAELTYKGYTANQFTGWVVNQSPAGTLNFIKTSTAPLTIADGALVTLKFDYLINTQADITFMGGTSIQSPSFAYIPTDFVDGFISTNYTLTATAGAHGALAAVYTGSYFWGTVVPIEGVPNTGYKFFNWTGTGAAYIADVSDATTTVTIPASNIAVQANFEVDPTQFFDLTITTGAHGTSTTGTGSYNVEEVVNITATAATGYRFKEWTGTGLAYVTDAVDATTTLTMPATAIGLTANFEPDPTQFFDLSLVLGANGTSVTGDGSYNVEDNVVITAVAASGYHFVEWTGDISYITTGTANDASVTVTMPAANIELTAVFAGYSVSGQLKYANPTGAARPITNSTVYLKTSDGLTTLQTTTSDASGNFTFTDVPDGSYKVDGATAKAWGGLTLADYAIVRNFVNAGTPVLAGIYWRAADVNLSNTVTLADYAIIRNRVNTGTTSGWLAPNWIIPQVSVTVSGATVTGVHVLGICSGDVNTSYTPPL
jgi:uncharacterized repeat protein (TIGR02543 family)